MKTKPWSDVCEIFKGMFEKIQNQTFAQEIKKEFQQYTRANGKPLPLQLRQPPIGAAKELGVKPRNFDR